MKNFIYIFSKEDAEKAEEQGSRLVTKMMAQNGTEVYVYSAPDNMVERFTLKPGSYIESDVLTFSLSF